MKTYLRRFTGLLLFAAALFTVMAIARAQEGTVAYVTITNSVPATPTNAVPVVGPLAPILDLLPEAWSPAKAVLMKLLIWLGSASLVFAGFSVKIQHFLTNLLNRAAASKEMDDDAWLAWLFKLTPYRVAATALRFLSIRLPTSDDLERAVAQQREAVAEARVNRTPSTLP